MDKDKFIKWLEVKHKAIVASCTDEHLNNPEVKSHVRGMLVTMEEIKKQVENGKFDKEEEDKNG